MKGLYWLSTVSVLIALVLVGCANDLDLPYESSFQTVSESTSAQPVTETSAESDGTLRVVPFQSDWEEFAPEDTGLLLAVGEGMASGPPAAVPTATVTRLSETEALVLLDRVPLLAGRPKTDALSLPTERLNPPSSGGLEVLPFPPRDAVMEVPADPQMQLQVLRYSPSADAELIPNVSITFSKPMVPLTSHATLADQELPVSLSPTPQGEWYWMGTRTLVFQPEGRLPGSTRYRVEIPSGVEAVDGSILEMGISWEFETGRLALVQSWPPDRPQPLRPHVALEFNQSIDSLVLESYISLRVAGREIPYALLKPELHELPADLQSFLSRTVPERTIVLQPLQAISPNTTLTVQVARGAPSAEGPLVTQAVQRTSLRTFGPLQVAYSTCRSQLEACMPGQGFYIEFNHDLDPNSLAAEMVSIDPPLPDGTVGVYPWGGMFIEGPTAPNTVYKLQLEPGLRDVFGQTFSSTREVLFYVGEQDPSLHFPRPMEVLYPSSGGQYSLYSRNLNRLRVILYQVEPKDWEVFLDMRAEDSVRNPARHLDREPVLDRTLALEASATQTTRTVLDLNPYLADGKGHLVMVLVPPQSLLETFFRGRRHHIVTWLQATSLGLDAYADQKSLVVHASSLATGESQANVDLQLLPQAVTAVTDARGHASFDLSEQPGGALLITARQGQDVAFLPQNLYWEPESHWAWPREHFHHRWHVFTDRNLYRPGEEVKIKGWVRRVEFSPEGDVTWAEPRHAQIEYQIYDSRGVELSRDTTHLDEHGALYFHFTVPENANSGMAYVQFAIPGLQNQGWQPGQYHEMAFRIEEFRRPEFEVAVTTRTGYHFLDEEVSIEVLAQYFGGGPLQGSPVAWQIAGQPSHYTPPGWDRFAFGIAHGPWWWAEEYFAYPESLPPGSHTAWGSHLDSRGRHSLTVTASASVLPVPHTLHVEATVQDLSQQSFSDSALVMIHPARLYVGGRTESYLAEVDRPYPLDVIVTDVAGQPVADQEIRIQARPDQDPTVREEALQEERTPTEPACRIQSAETAVTCDLVFAEPGRWQIDITVLDAQGKPNLTRLTRWVAGSRETIIAGASPGLVEMIADKEEYQPGDMAEILIQPPFQPAYGTVITNRSGIVTRTPIEITQAQHVLQVPIEESHVPNLYVSVLLTGQSPNPDLGDVLLPAMARGDLNLKVPPHIRTLDLDLSMVSHDLLPGGEASLTVTVSDAAGQPVPDAEVVLLAVDEAVLALTGYQFLHPLDSFYPDRFLELYTYHLRQYLQPVSDIGDMEGVGGGMSLRRQFGLDMTIAASPAMMEEMEEGAAAPMAAAADESPTDTGYGTSADSQVFRIRTDFNPLAVFEPSGTTDAEGQFHATWDLPDTVGRYRIIALATSGPHLYGLAETSYLSRLPIQIRPQLPRFLNFGDQASLSVLVENQTDEDQDLFLVVQSDGLDLAYQSADRAIDALSFTLPAQSRQQILVPATARDTGASQLLLSIFNEQLNDSALGSFPVYVPAAQEGFAAYGIVEETMAVQGLQLPEDVHRNFGQLTISTSSTVLQSLLDSYGVLRETRGWDYPERIASRLMANIALRDVLYAFNQPELPERGALDRRIQTDIEDLIQFQQYDGGFPLWDSRNPSWPFVSVHSLHALAVARSNGYEVAEDSIQQGLLYLSAIEQHFLHYYSPETRRYITAYALYVRSLLGDVDPLATAHLLGSTRRESHPLEVVAWCLLVLHQDPSSQDQVHEWMEFVLNQVDETTGKASFAREAIEQDGYLVLQSARRSDALLLSALMTIQSESDLIPKVVNGLLTARGQHGHWGSSQDNVFVLQAMNQYFRLYEAVTPDFVARVWLDDTLVVNAPFQDRETEIRQVALPMAWLFEEAPERIRIQRGGAGRLYYRLGLDYVPDDLQLEPRERGFTVLRTYAGVDDPADVWQDPEGIWHMKLGTRVRIDVTLVAPGQRHHVLLASPLPAGLELVNPALEGSRSFQDPNAQGWYYWPWFDHQQLLDERAQAVTTWLPGGVYQYGVIAEATTAGTFQVPPARAVEIYAPETFGYGASEIVVVEPE